jgi:hypothetical protein
VAPPANAGAAKAANATQEIIIRFMFLILFKSFVCLQRNSQRHSNCLATGFRRCFKFSQTFDSTTLCVGGLPEHRYVSTNRQAQPIVIERQ